MDDQLEFSIVNDLDEKEFTRIMDGLIAIKDKEILEYRNKKKRNQSIASGLYGFIVGDAFGVPYEFVERKNVMELNDGKMREFGTHDKPAGTWSDDTSMTLATLESIIEKSGIDYEDIMVRFCAWLFKGKYTTDGKVFDVGITTNKALKLYANTNLEAHKCGSLGITENGNGSLMRILPVCVYLSNSELDEEEEVEIINNVSSITHAHEISKLGCFIYYQYIKNLLNGLSKEDAYNEICNYDYSKFYSKESLDYYTKLLSNNISNESIESIKSSGFIVDTLEAVFWSILNTNDYKESIIESVNLGGDTDTIGAITGSISGILYGYENIPEEWLDKIPRQEYLNDLINSFDNEIIMRESRGKGNTR